VGRYSVDDGLGLEFLGLVTGSNTGAEAPPPAVQPTSFAVEPAPLVHDEAPGGYAESWSLGLTDDGPARPEPLAPLPALAQPVPTIAQSTPLTRREARALEEARANAAAAQTALPSTSPVPLSTSTVPRRRDVVTPSRSVKSRAPRSAPSTPAQKSPARRRVSAGSKLLSLGAMLFAGALVIGMSVPVNALMSTSPQAVAAVGAAAPLEAQSVAISSAAALQATPRDSFTVISYADIMHERYGNQAVYTFTPTTGAVRWPFPYSVPISDGWGSRVSPCTGCSTFHQGVDFTPGVGSPIYAIADGVVTYHADTDRGLGNNVTISHVINGENIDSVYAHMITGSSKLVVGDAIKVGDFIGFVGETGSATGPHLHFELHVDKVPVDPFAWLTANAVN
jgi:murein DD-endopeptidase MepM/ murein hydrolase activator NlpD